MLNAADGRIAFRFHARDVHLVMGPATRGSRGAVPCARRRRGSRPRLTASTSTKQGNGTLPEQRLHQLIRQPGSITDRTFEISFGAPGAEAYCFTFG